MMTTVVSELGLAIGGSSELTFLVKATLVLLAGIALLRATQQARASARYLLVAATFGMLLLLPAASAFMPPIAIGVLRSTPSPAATRMSAPLPVAETVRPGDPVAIALRNAPDVTESITSAGSVRVRSVWLLRVVWLAGGLLCAAPILLALWRARSLSRTAVAWQPGNVLVSELSNEAGVARRVPVLRHEGVATPMTCGFLRPVILLPWDAPDWAETDLRRALIHELEHVRRGDWPAQLLARGVCAAYWFHPLVWRCWRHLHLEAERACDDAVVRQTGGATYASQLVRLAERMSDDVVLPILAMANRGDLAARVRSVLDTRRRRERAGPLWILGAAIPAVVCVAAIAPLRAVTVGPFGDRFLPRVTGSSPEAPAAAHTDTLTEQDRLSPKADALSTPQERPEAIQVIPEERFAAATVRRGITVLRGVPIPATVMARVPAGRALGMVTYDENGFIATGVPIGELIERAYGIGMSGLRPLPFTSIEGVPSWTERFDIEARTPRPIAKVKGGQEAAELRAMLRHLLADRFQLIARWESREKTAYQLVRDGALGPRLQSCVEAPSLCEGPNRGYRGSTQHHEFGAVRTHSLVGMPLRDFVRNLQLDVRRPIEDRTGLEGSYALDLVFWMPRGPDSPRLGTGAPAELPPPLESALREQLGLRLESRTIAEDVLVVDRIALPSYDSP